MGVGRRRSPRARRPRSPAKTRQIPCAAARIPRVQRYRRLPPIRKLSRASGHRPAVEAVTLTSGLDWCSGATDFDDEPTANAGRAQHGGRTRTSNGPAPMVQKRTDFAHATALVVESQCPFARAQSFVNRLAEALQRSCAPDKAQVELLCPSARQDRSTPGAIPRSLGFGTGNIPYLCMGCPMLQTVSDARQ